MTTSDAGPSPDLPRKAVRVRVHGVVQGVFFRASTREVAEYLGLAGWVRNRPDGSVEAHFQGPAPAVDEAIRWCATGPRHAVVDRIETEDVDWDDRWRGFMIVKERPD